MHKKIIIGVLAVMVAVLALGAYFYRNFSAPKKVFHVGIVSGADIFKPVSASFKEKMASLGYVEGTDVIYDEQDVNGDPALIQQAAQKLINEKVDLIVAFPTEPALVLKELDKNATIPIVFVGDIEGAHIVESALHPGGNITGVRIAGVDAIQKRLELLHDIVPQAKRYYLPYDASYPISQAMLDVIRPEAASLGITLVEMAATSSDQIVNDLTRRDAGGGVGFDAILSSPNPMVSVPPAQPAIAAFAQKHKLPISGNLANQITAGALFTLVAPYESYGQAVAQLVDKVLRGADAGMLPLETPTMYLTINYLQAQSIGLKLSQDILSQADVVITK